MSYARIQAAHADGVLRLTLNAPPLNILDVAMMREIRDALARAPEDTWAIVVTGAGERAFSAGADIREHTADRVREMLTTFHGVFEDLAERDAVSIAAVRGLCLGGGCELALACDLVVAADDASFGQPEIAVGCFPPVAAILLPGLVGPKRAAEMVLTGAPIGADDARAAGLVNRVVPAARLGVECDALVEKLRAHSPAVLRLARRALRFGAGDADAFRAHLRGVEDLYFRELVGTTDMSEGVTAFIEKRRPTWSGR